MAKSKKKTPDDVFKKPKVRKKPPKVEQTIVEDDMDTIKEDEAQQEAEVVDELKEEVTAEPKVEKLSTPKVPEQPNTKLVTLQKHLKEYQLYHAEPVITPAIREKILRKFYLILRFAINNPQNDILDELYVFFRKNRNGILAESVVFQGISQMATGPRFQIETFYTLFTALIATKTQKAKFTVSLEAARRVLGVDEIINYVSIKLNK